jgi:predicted RNase H-like HicB family nuclease
LGGTITGKEVLRRIGSSVVDLCGRRAHTSVSDVPEVVRPPFRSTPTRIFHQEPFGASSATWSAASVGTGEGDVMTYRVVLDRDEGGAWIASVPDVPGCHSYGRSIEQATNRIREALVLWVDDAEEAELDVRPRLPKQQREMVRRALHARERATAAETISSTAVVQAIEALSKYGLSRRDTARLVELSPQRVQQLVQDRSRGARSGRRKVAARKATRRGRSA